MIDLELFNKLKLDMNKKVLPKQAFFESHVYEFFVSPEETISKYGITDKDNWSNPSILPNKFDLDWNGWFRRISNWGTVKILHVDPENKKRGDITKSEFIRLMSTSDMLKVYGKFRTEIIKIHRMEFIRDYVGIDGKQYKEIFQINVDLKPELRKGLHFWQGIF